MKSEGNRLKQMTINFRSLKIEKIRGLTLEVEQLRLNKRLKVPNSHKRNKVLKKLKKRKKRRNKQKLMEKRML